MLANEEVVNGVGERCGSEVIRKNQSQWMLKITAYAQRLVDDLDDLDFIDPVSYTHLAAQRRTACSCAAPALWTLPR